MGKHEMGRRRRRIVAAVVFLAVCQVSQGMSLSRVPPKFEGKPLLLDSFIPAGMQIISHVTELMKYEITPQRPVTGTVTTTTTIKPTPSHKPAIFSPQKPPLGQKLSSTYEEYLKRLNQTSGPNYFDRYNLEGRTNENVAEDNDVPEDLDKFVGKNYVDVFKLTKQTGEFDAVPEDEDDHVQNFLKDFDDNEQFRRQLLRQKKVPPTKAYVTLLSLYDLLNKETKRLGFNKYGGYSDIVLKQLVEASTSTSSYQLRTVLNQIVERDDTKKPDVVKKIKQLVDDLDQHNSYINMALKYIPPLAFEP